MFKLPDWLNLKEFLNTHQEWHALVIGWGDGVSFRKTDWYMLNVYYGTKEKMRQELHYYKFGLALGFFSILGFVAWLVSLAV